MSYFLKSKRIDASTGSLGIVLINEKEAWHFGIRAGDRLKLTIKGKSRIVSANTSRQRVRPGQIGLFRDIWEKQKIKEGEVVQVDLLERAKSVQAIKKRLLGKRLKYEEIHQIISDIVEDKLSKIEITYFVASGFMNEYTNQELYYLTKAVAETGETLKFKGVVADKHSIGGLPGNRTTMIVIPIIASLGIRIPKTSSRAITSPAGTADTMEVVAPVAFTSKEIRDIVTKTGACMVWGGGVNLAPADDKIIKVSYPLSLEPYNKMIVSIMAKKVAMGVTHLVVAMSIGPTTKVPNQKVANELIKKFQYVAKQFGIKLKVVTYPGKDPIGFGIGPALEARDVLRVLQQKANRPGDLEKKGAHLAGELLELLGHCKKGKGAELAWKQLDSGAAWKKMQQIIKAQGGDPSIDSESITIGAIKKYVTATKSGKISAVDNKQINNICRILGAPSVKLAGIYLNKEFGMRVKKGERLFTMYTDNKERMRLAQEALQKLSIFTIG